MQTVTKSVCPAELRSQEIIDRIKRYGDVSFDGLASVLAAERGMVPIAGAEILYLKWHDFYQAVAQSLALSGKSIDELRLAVQVKILLRNHREAAQQIVKENQNG